MLVYNKPQSTKMKGGQENSQNGVGREEKRLPDGTNKKCLCWWSNLFSTMLNSTLKVSNGSKAREVSLLYYTAEVFPVCKDGLECEGPKSISL